MLAAGSGGGVSKWLPTTPLDVAGGLLAQFGGSTGAAFVYELFDLGQDPPALSPYSDPIPVWIAGGTDQIPPGAASIPASLLASMGTVTDVGGVLTWHDPGTNTPRVVMTPDGSGGYTSEVL